MRKSLFLSALVVAASASIGIAEGHGDRPAQCLLVVMGTKAIDGECTFTSLGKDGSFQISSYNGTYFAQVSVTASGIGDGYWNEEPYADHAHSPLGVLFRRDACWANEIASICAR